MSARGRLVVFEGGEGCGKSTQASLLASAMSAVLTREPGGTQLGERIRSLMLDRANLPLGLSGRAELFLMGAARAQHIEQVIIPAVESGKDVVCDRFTGSTIAYQGYGRGLALDEVSAACEIAAGGLVPDLSILLEVPPSAATARVNARQGIGMADRIESEDAEFHQRVWHGFRQIADDDPVGWVVIDASGSIDEVAQSVLHEVSNRLGISNGQT